jgi:hypothetical protein
MRGGCIGVVLLIAVSAAFAYPPDPDNAAMLYYQAFLLDEQPDEATSQLLDDFVKGTIGPSDKIKEYVQSCRSTINYALMATEREHCNWGIVYSKGFSMALPHLAQCRRLSKLMLADARLLAAQGAYDEALERCLSTKKLARHVGDGIVISLLVGHAINALADDCIREILGMTSPDPQVLQWLKGQLLTVSTPAPSFAKGLKLEQEMALDMMRMDRLEELTEVLKSADGSTPNGPAVKIDEEFLARNREYYERYMTALQATLAAPMSYEKKHAELKAMVDRMTQEASKSPDAVLTTALVPALNRVYSIEAKSQARANALRVGVEILLARTQAGALPEHLPANMPKDPFSDQDYLYEKTGTGFVLRCQGKDLDKDTTYEYAFAVK